MLQISIATAFRSTVHALSTRALVSALSVCAACEQTPDGALGSADAATPSAGAGGAAGSALVDRHDPDAHVWDFEFLEDAGDGWQVLLAADWEIPAGDEFYRCAHFTVPSDVSLVRFKVLSPPGTHHTGLGVYDTRRVRDGVSSCGSVTGGDRRLLGGGVGSEPSDPFPDGVAMELRSGNQLSLNLHLFNVGDETLTGRSGVLVRVGEAAAPGLQASSVLAGPVGLRIPPGEVTQQGSCTFQSAATLFAIAPHMHQLGTHLVATAVRNGFDPVVLFDEDYDFDRQVGTAIQPIEMAEGDALQVRCTYQNDTDATVRFGDSSLAEMCFANLTFYPASAFSAQTCTF